MKLTKIYPTYDFRDFPNDRFSTFKTKSHENSMISPTYDFRFKIAILEF